MVVSDALAAVEFLRAVFGAVGVVQAGRPAEVRIGDSVVIVTSAGERGMFPASKRAALARLSRPARRSGPARRVGQV